MTPKNRGGLEPLSGGVVAILNVFGELFPELDPNQMSTKEEDTTWDVVNKTVSTEDNQRSTRGNKLPYKTKDNERRHPKILTTVLYPQLPKSTQDKICYNCVNQGHVSRTCPIKSRLCSEIDFSPGPSKQRPSLYDLGQEEYFGRGDETTEGKGVTIDTGVELLSVSFRGLAPHGGVGKPKTKAELKTFPKTTLMFPVSIRLNLGSTIFQPGMTSADDNNKSPCESESS